MLKIVNLGWMIWPEIYETEPDWFLKSWTFVDWLLDIFQNRSDFYQGSSAPNWKSYLESSPVTIFLLSIKLITLNGWLDQIGQYQYRKF